MSSEDKSLITHIQELWHLAEKQAAMEKKIEAIADRVEDVYTAIVGIRPDDFTRPQGLAAQRTKIKIIE